MLMIFMMLIVELQLLSENLMIKHYHPTINFPDWKRHTHTQTHTPPAVPGAMDCDDKGGCGVVRGVGLALLGPEDKSLWRLKALVRLVCPVQNQAMQDNNQFSPIYYLDLIQIIQ